MNLNRLLTIMYNDTRIHRRFFAVSYMYGLSVCPNVTKDTMLGMLKVMRCL